MKKLSKKFKVLLIIIIALSIVFICGKCQASSINYPDASQFRTTISSEEEARIARDNCIGTIKNLIRLFFPIIMVLCPTIRFIIIKIKISKEDISEEERKEKNKKCFDGFKKWIVINGLIGLSVSGVISITQTYDKPIIYLYPEKETEVSVKLGNPQDITVSYPKYVTGWEVLAKPNGDLIDLNTNRNLYALYYESENEKNYKVEDGFVVEGEKSAEFFEEKLAILGLNEREAEEFIVYWLPKLESNKYNYIRFATLDEINDNMPLEIDPKPDSLIRILMVYKGLNGKIDVKEQELITPKREGFVVVEWGGTEIK